jgi:hypothetical protein
VRLPPREAPERPKVPHGRFARRSRTTVRYLRLRLPLALALSFTVAATAGAGLHSAVSNLVLPIALGGAATCLAMRGRLDVGRRRSAEALRRRFGSLPPIPRARRPRGRRALSGGIAFAAFGGSATGLLTVVFPSGQHLLWSIVATLVAGISGAIANAYDSQERHADWMVQTPRKRATTDSGQPVAPTVGPAEPRLLGLAAVFLPSSHRGRFLEEWQRHLLDLPNRRRRVTFTFGLVIVGIPRLTLMLRRRPVRADAPEARAQTIHRVTDSEGMLLMM